MRSHWSWLYDRLAEPPALAAVAALVVIVSVVSFGRYPAIGGDDFYISDPALHLATDGTLACTTHRGGGFEIFNCLPPILPVSVALSYAVFGFGVIQSKLPCFLYGLGTALLVFACAWRLGGSRAARIATMVFMLDPVTYGVWQSGRNDAPFIFFLTAAIAVSYYCATHATGANSPVYWGLAGVCAGLAGLAYYPFALIGGAVCLLAMFASLSADARVTIPRRAACAGAFMVGAGFIISIWGAILWPHLALCRAQLMPYPGDYFGKDLWRFTSEFRRYQDYAVRNLGFANLALGIAVLFAIPKLTRERWVFVVLWIAPLLFVAFLVIYVWKIERYLAGVVLFWSLGLAFVLGQLETGNQSFRALQMIRPLVCLTLVVALIRIALLAFTLVYQWNGRDYRVFEAQIRSNVTRDSSVIAPQEAWYPLAPITPRIWIYSQGYDTWDRETRENLMDDPAYINQAEYVILSDYWTRKKLHGLRDYTRTHFLLVKRVRLPFTPLPWAKNAPYDVDIYRRVPLSAQPARATTGPKPKYLAEDR